MLLLLDGRMKRSRLMSVRLAGKERVYMVTTPLFERVTGRIFIEPYDKLKKDEDDRMFGPPTVDNVRPLL